MIRLGLIGHPLSHSLSPVIQTAALQSCGLAGDYSLFPILPDDKQGLKDLLGRVRRGEIHGLNVTIPHKQNVIEFLDDLTQTASAIGAVNLIHRQDDKLIGANTDAPGFLSDLKRFLITETQRHGVSNALVLGAGGSARAVVYSLLHDGWKVTIAARRREQAQQLAESFMNYKSRITFCTLSEIDDHSTNLQSPVSDLSLIVNTTPVGMTPDINRSPWPQNLPFPADAAIYDLVYNPRQTRLARDAHSQGRPAITGLGMLIEQAALAFQIWTGYRPSREVMFASVSHSSVSNL